MSAAKILINIVKAEGLLAKDKGGTSDPFAEVRYGKQIKKTRVIQKTLNPEWNELIVLDKDAVELSFDVVVYDHDKGLIMGSSSEFLGCVTIPLSTVREEDPISEWFNLEYNRKYQKKFENITGRVYLEVSLGSKEIAESAAATAAEAAAAAALTRDKSDASSTSGGGGGFFSRAMNTVFTSSHAPKSRSADAPPPQSREVPPAGAAADAAGGSGVERAGRDVVKELVRVTLVRAEGLVPRDPAAPVSQRPGYA